MWLATCEHEDGTFWDEPIAGYTKDEVRTLALRKWSDAPRDTALMLWKCSEQGEITRLAPSELRDLREKTKT